MYIRYIYLHLSLKALMINYVWTMFLCEKKWIKSLYVVYKKPKWTFKKISNPVSSTQIRFLIGTQECGIEQLHRVGPVAVLPNHLPVHRIDGMLIVRDELELGYSEIEVCIPTSKRIQLRREMISEHISLNYIRKKQLLLKYVIITWVVNLWLCFTGHWVTMDKT